MKSDNQKNKVFKIKWRPFILLSVSFAILFRILVIDMYKVPSSSMEPTLLPGDRIIVCKLNYGARFVNLIKFLKHKEIDFFRFPGLSTVKKGDILVLNSHKINYYNKADYNNYREIVVKRCFTTPGYLTIIKKDIIKDSINGNLLDNADFFPRYYRNVWSIDNYGPLYVPSHDDLITLTKTNVQIYKHIILAEEPNIQICDSIGNSDATFLPVYKIKRDYYFVLGDNFYNSIDSRNWGLVSDKDIIGKVVAVLFSIDNSKKGLNSVRFNRIFRMNLN